MWNDTSISASASFKSAGEESGPLIMDDNSHEEEEEEDKASLSPLSPFYHVASEVPGRPDFARPQPSSASDRLEAFIVNLRRSSLSRNEEKETEEEMVINQELVLDAQEREGDFAAEVPRQLTREQYYR